MQIKHACVMTERRSVSFHPKLTSDQCELADMGLPAFITCNFICREEIDSMQMSAVSWTSMSTVKVSYTASQLASQPVSQSLAAV